MFSKKITNNSVSILNAYPRVLLGLEKFSKLALAISMSAVLAACGSDGDEPAEMLDPDGRLVDAQGNLVDAEGNLIDDDGNVIIQPSMTVGVEKTALKAGESTDFSVRFTDQNDELLTAAAEVIFSSNCLSNDLALIEGETSSSTGIVNVSYTAKGCRDEDEITIYASISDKVIQSVTTLTIEPDAVLSVQFISAEPPQLAIKGTGGQVESRLTFQLTGQLGAPIIGESVTFRLEDAAGGVELSNDTDMSGSGGQVSTIVKSGTVHTTATVVATHDATGEEGVSDGISISSGVPLFSKFSLSAGPQAVPDAFNTDGKEMSVSIIASDQFGNDVPDGTEISFASPEFGNIDAACTLESGQCSVTWRSSGSRPGDGRFEIIAYTVGAEDFTDANGNGVFDDGDFTDLNMNGVRDSGEAHPPGNDLAEAFADENENGVYDAGEFFVDYNKNGQYDGADGLWNGPLCKHTSLCSSNNTMIFKSLTAVASTNLPVEENAGDFASFNTITAGQTAVLGGYILSDSNSNSLPAGTTIKFSTDVGELQGASDFEVKSNEINPNGPFSIRLKTTADDADESGTIEVEVTTPSGDSRTFFYDFTVTP